MIVFDTDMVSTFGKLRRLDLFKEMFPCRRLVIPTGVYQELSRAKEMGYTFVDYILESVEVVSLTKEELNLVGELDKTSLDSGEKECLAICKKRDYVLLTNDTQAKNKCKEKSVDFIDLHAFLRKLWKSEIMSKDEVDKLIDEIETKDKVKIKDKRRIFRD